MKKLLSRKGSVLFLVVVVMSILIIAASATFYIVNNQSNSVNVRYSSEQSYQTALSVSDTVSKYIDGYLEAIAASGNELSDYSDTLIGKMLKLPIGSSSDITSSFDLSDENMGEASVTITKKKQIPSPDNPENTSHIYEITTKSEYKGETITITEVKEIVTGPTDYFTRFLTSTGNRPEDVVFQCSVMYSDAYFENDYTDFGGGATNIRNSIYATGTFIDNGIGYVKTGPNEIVIGENFYVLSSGGGGSSSTVDVDYIFVRGNMVVKSGANKMFKSKGVYVLGDLILDGEIGSNPTNFFVEGNCYINTHTGSADSFYVGKNLYIGSGVNGGLGTFVVQGDIDLASNCNGSAVSMKCKGNITNNAQASATFNPTVDAAVDTLLGTAFTNAAAAGSPVSDWSEASKYIIKKTKANKYEDWDAEGYFIDNLASTVPVLDLSSAPNLITDWTTDPNHGVYDDANIKVEQYNQYWSRTLLTIKKSCKITPIKNPPTGGKWNGDANTIVFDATSSDLYIYLDSNGMTDENGKKLFSFFDGYNGTNILIRGSHSVIFILPSDTNFKMNTQQFIGHEDLAFYLSDYTSAWDMVKNEIRAYKADNESTKLKIEPILETVAVDSVTTATRMKQSVVGGSAHNNIFLVSTGRTRGADGKLTATLTNNYFNFNIQSGFCGYIYAPYSEMLCNGGYSGMQFFGGLIIGTYTYKNSSALLAFTTPYDYADNYKAAGETNYKKTDLVKRLISFSNNNGVPGGSSQPMTLQAFNTIGYK